MGDQAPAYQMYAGDWLKSRSVRFMDDYQRGWYIQLLNEAWDGTPQCMLPIDDDELQQLASISDLAKSQPDFNARWAAVKKLFIVEGTYCYNERQMDELAKQDHRREIAVKGGNASAKKRAEKRKELQRIKRELLAKGNGRSKPVKQKGNGDATLPTPSSSSIPPPTSSAKKISEDAKRLSIFLLDEVSKAEDRKLVSRPASGHKPIQMLINDGVTPADIQATIVWLTTENMQRQYHFAVQSGKALREKWDKIQAARNPAQKDRPPINSLAAASGNVHFMVTN